jgi:hypothetical protein
MPKKLFLYLKRKFFHHISRAIKDAAYSGETCHPFREKTCHFLNNFKLKLSNYLMASFVQNFFPFFFA